MAVQPSSGTVWKEEKVRDLVILGSTGSIGTQALDVVRANRELFQVRALAAGGGRLELLARQAVEFQVPLLAIFAGDEAQLRGELARASAAAGLPELPWQIHLGGEGICQAAAAAPDGTVLNGIDGVIGLEPTLAALSSGATLALANKESLVIGYALVCQALQRPGQIVPVDSEHSAIYQALRSGRHHRGLTSENIDGQSEVAKVILTASGGPFRGKTRAELAQVTPAQALNHPTWDMGPLVTINSSTLFNKGLEVIEAAYLFGLTAQQIEAVIHPQSIVHSLVEWQDGSVIAQASPPDMRLPIALGISAPGRLKNVAPACSWTQASSWTFEAIDHQTFPAVNLALQCLQASVTHPSVYTSANESCVRAFLAGQLPYLQIFDTVSQVLADYEGQENPSLDDLHQIIDWAKQRAQEIITKVTK